MGKFLTRRDVAREYPITFSSLAHLACSGAGPAYALIGKRAVYARADVEEWLSSQLVRPIQTETAKAGRGRPRKIPSR